MTAESSYGYHTAGQICLDELREILSSIDGAEADAMLEKKIVNKAKEFERVVREGLQRFPQSEHLLVLDSDYRKLISQFGQAEIALTKVFEGNPRLDWIAARLASMLDAGGKYEDAKKVLVRCL